MPKARCSVCALRMFWQRSVDCFRDPIRWRHLVWRAVEGYVGGLAAMGLTMAAFLAWPEDAWQWATLVTAPVGVPVAEFIVYEFFIEPWARARVARGLPSTAGPYWERGARDGERLTYE